MSSKSSYNHSDPLKFLLSLETQGIKLGLNRTKKLLSCCGNPEKNIISVQVIGTNGKGSTSSSLFSILKQNKLNVGLYTSPHLVHFNERIQINDKCIPNSYIEDFIEKYKNKIIELSCTFFEVLTVLALDYFKFVDVDIAILETGLGGRYDSVSACEPALHLFTHISKDHMHILGDSIEEIATNKAHAIKNNVPCISVAQNKSVENILNQFAKERSTKIDYQIYTNEYDLENSPLFGKHQKANLLLAIKASKNLYKISRKTINKGISNINWPGRLQVLQKNPTVIFDVSHNEKSIQAFYEFISSTSIKGKKTLIISIQKTKNIQSKIDLLLNFFDDIICTQLNTRMYSNQELLKLFKSNRKVRTSSNIFHTMKETINNSDQNDYIAIVGSHYWGKTIENFFKISLVSK